MCLPKTSRGELALSPRRPENDAGKYDDEDDDDDVFHFLNSLANAARASVGAPEEVCRSTTVRGAYSSHVLLAFLLTMRFVIFVLHSK